MNTYLDTGIITDDNGIVNGFFSGQQDRVDELNYRIQNRQFPDNALRPNFDPRPVPTKYAIFPVIDRKTPAKYPLEKNYLDDYGFSPATKNGPPKNYLHHVDVETILRNQTVALQHGAHQGVFVPSSASDLYHVSMPHSRSSVAQPFPNLFERPTFETSGGSAISQQEIGKSVFYNNTRTQLRNTINMPR
jgi:hypothetical protein